tara:strand:+ start:553 stop:915 length:363 start_codon:yes stop_codon:yes gene_type:complete
MGLGATALMDFRAPRLYRSERVALPNWVRVGRWVIYLPRGWVFHSASSAAQLQLRELQIGWAFHYLVGVLYGLFFTLLAGPTWIAELILRPVFVYALAIIAGRWFALHTGLGLGWAASKA